MTLNSMTGFARAGGGDETLSWTWEIRCVNGKGLDVRLRLPPGLEALEPRARKALAARFRRGNMQASLQIGREGEAAALSVNVDLLEWYARQARALNEKLGAEAAPLDALKLLNMRGVIETADPARALESRAEAIMETFEAALEDLAESRAKEGARLQEVISARIDELERLARRARDNPARAPKAIRARLREQLARIMEAGENLDEQRLYQEAALLAVRADIAEELDRLDAHVAAARALLEEEGAVGRKFDFLAQEFNREANTLCSKSNDPDLTRVGLEMKVVIDQLREQLANIE